MVCVCVHTSDATIPAALPLGLLDLRGESIGEVGKQLVLEPHWEPQESVQETRESGRVLL